MFTKSRNKGAFKKSLIAIIFVSWLGLLFFSINNYAQKVYAAVENAGVLQISYPGNGPLFAIENAVPGMNEPRTVTVKNNGSNTHSLSIATQGSLGHLASQTTIEVRNTSDNSLIWSKKLNEISTFPNYTEVLPSIDPGATKEVNIIAILPTDLDNSYQNQSTLVFDFVVGNENNEATENGESGDNSDSAEPAARSKISSPTSDQNQSDNQLAEEAIQKESLPNGEVLGAQKENSGEAKGVGTCVSDIWWWILLLIFAVILIIYGFITKRKDNIWKFIPPVAIALITYIIYLVLDKTCCTESIWCKYFLLLEVIELAIYELVMYLATLKKDPTEPEQNRIQTNETNW